jgi:microcystin-dependent protein
MASDPYVAEISMFAGNFAPTGWALCNGQIMPISQNTALFSLLGTMYGGNGQTTFALPNLQATIPMCHGQGQGLSERFQGEMGGADTVALLTSEIPVHSHPVESGSATPSLRCASGPGNQTSPVGNVSASETHGVTATYGDSGAAQMALPVTTQATGSSVPHNNLPPLLAVTFIIALQGVFPPRG